MIHKMLVAVALLSLSSACAADPLLGFSDLVSGPRTGNSDTSLGQVANANGAIVTVWGKNLGASQGTSKIFINGAEARVYSWGNATAPADLFTRHQMQMICAQVSGTATDGAGAISVVVNGVTGNTLPFTVRTGKIFFVKTAGSDSTGDGSWTKPWKTFGKAIGGMAAGDTTYLCDGVSQTTVSDFGAAVDLGLNGQAARPAAFVAYPGATVNVGSDSCQRGFHNFMSGFGGVSNWVISKLRIRANESCVVMGSDFRIVGNYVTAPTGSAPEGAIEGDGNNLFVIGNEVTAIGRAGCSKLYHPIYISSARTGSGPRLPAEANREIAWNYLHDNNANRAINIYSEQASTAYMSNHRVHDNFIINQVGGGMLLGQYMTGENHVYNNVIANAGLGPEPSDGNDQSHIGVEIEPGVDGGPATTMYFYNNTIYGCGWSGARIGPSANGNMAIDRLSTYTLKFFNNIIVSTGQPYLASGRPSVSARDAYSVWFGSGAAPGFDTKAFNVDPKFVGASGFNFHLASNSPVLNAGTSQVNTVVVRDFDGLSRPQGTGYEPGAFEFDAGGTTPTFTISGTITSGVAGLSGVTVSDGTRTATTDASGNYAIGGVPAGSYTLTPSKATYTFTPATRAVSVTNANVTAQNFTGATAPNTAPTISDITSKSTNEDAVTGAIAFTIGDAETPAASLTLSKASSNTALVPAANIVFSGSGASRTVTITPAANKSGTATITVSVSDGALATSDTFVLTVNAVNDAPVANAQAVSVRKNASAAIALTASDIDGDALTYSIVALPSHGTLTGTPPNVTYTPTRRYSGPDSFTFRARDAALNSNTATVSINVTRTAPTLASEVTATPNPAVAGQSVAISAAPSDDDGDTLACDWDLGDGTTGAGVSVSHAFAIAGQYVARLTVTDEDGLTASAAVTITVTASDDGGGDGGGSGPTIIDLGSVAQFSRVKITLPLPESISGPRLTFKTTSALPAALHLGRGYLSGKAKTPGAFTFDVVITRKERVRGADGKFSTRITTVTQGYKLTVMPKL